MLLYPISVLSGSVLLYRRPRAASWPALATLFYAGMLWARARRAGPAAGALPDVPVPAGQAPLLLDLRDRRRLRHRRPDRLLPGREPARASARSSRRRRSRWPTCRSCNQVDRQQHPQRPAHRRRRAGASCYVNEFGEAILGRRGARAARARACARSSAPVLLEPPALRRARGRTGAWRGSSSATRARTGERVDLGRLGLAAGDRRAGRRGYLLVFQDLTEIKRLEREVRIKEKLAAVGEMAAHLAHEIRNPLGSISGSAQVLHVASRTSRPSRSACWPSSRASPSGSPTP